MKKALIGYGGHAHEVMAQMGVKLTCFVNDEYVVNETLPLSSLNTAEYAVMVAVGDSKDRADIVNKLPKDTRYFSWIHPTALIMDEVEIGEGSFIGAYSILTSNIKIGKHALLNRGNHIGHDCVIGNFFSAMPGAIVSGNVNIGNNCYIGTNSSIREKCTICNNVTLGMNSFILKDIYEPGTYYRSSFLNKK
jgi:sugar O-acyltransferase (sialic acid O-acetyltransferase NeuD family)